MMPTIEELVDHLGATEAALETPEAAIILAKIKKAEMLRKLVREQVKAAPEDTVEVWGRQYMATIGPRENQTKILSLSKVYQIVKKSAFLAHASLTLKALEQLIPDARDRAKLIHTERTGSRPVSTYPVGRGAKDQKAA